MRLVYWKWSSFFENSIVDALDQLNVEYIVYEKNIVEWENNKEFEDTFEKFIECINDNKKIDAIFSINYNPIIAKIANNKEIIYISWIYDSPIHIRDLSTMKYKTNRIFTFDRGQVECFKKQGIESFHLPLRCDYNHLQKIIRETKASKMEEYKSDISFVGKLYNNDYPSVIEPLYDYEKGYIEGVIRSQMQLYGAYIVDELVTNNLIKKMNQAYKERVKEKFQVTNRQIEFLIASEITRRERRIVLTILSHENNVVLYSNENNEKMKDVINKGYIDYDTKLPLVFYNSKINLNISLKTIRTGIPLRVWEILGSDGFLISNFQEELAEYFDIGNDIVLYDDVEQLVGLTDFYLRNESERNRIRENGIKRLKSYGTIKDQVKRMLEQI
ncbi:glycosyltransferase family protein [Lachnobacterium bovis]|uniref:glycosyltransferase family protein n=1 Tax=Lachnobacterium bovis TaxID=140626 RepID=UPI0003B5D797|nr:DUF3880 domain-containing protein [Lachnobacterium bovis]